MAKSERKNASGKNPKVDAVLKKADRWQREIEALREIVLGTGLVEELKWGQPCYTTEDDRNIVLIHGFKEYCALLFMKGALIEDAYGLLVQQTRNVQSARQIRFRNLREITETRDVVREYVEKAIEVERSGAKVRLKTSEEYEMPEELAARIEADRKLKAAFERLTPGRQRGYMFYIGQAKQSKTREARVDKVTPMILKGKGLND